MWPDRAKSPFVLKIEKLSHIIGAAAMLKIALAYGLTIKSSAQDRSEILSLKNSFLFKQIGLAVGDIESIQKNAELKLLAIEVWNEIAL